MRFILKHAGSGPVQGYGRLGYAAARFGYFVDTTGLVRLKTPMNFGRIGGLGWQHSPRRLAVRPPAGAYALWLAR